MKMRSPAPLLLGGVNRFLRRGVRREGEKCLNTLRHGRRRERILFYWWRCMSAYYLFRPLQRFLMRCERRTATGIISRSGLWDGAGGTTWRRRHRRGRRKLLWPPPRLPTTTTALHFPFLFFVSTDPHEREGVGDKVTLNRLIQWGVMCAKGGHDVHF